MNNKKELRTEIRDKRNEISENEIKDKSLKIVDKLMSLEVSQSSRNVMVYAPFDHEVDIKNFTDFCLKKNKGVVLPKVCSDKIDLDIFWVDDLKKLERGTWGVLEPKVNLCEKFEKKKLDLDLDLVIVPGVGFDRECNRLGMGKGFYDKFLNKVLSTNKRVKFVGVCYDFQIVDKLDTDAHDVPMDLVISESNTYCRRHFLKKGGF